MTSSAIERIGGGEIVDAAQAELTVGQLVGQTQKIQQAMQKAMKDGEHFGVIPGTDKPTLLKPGAEKLCLLFRLDPEYEIRERHEPHGHYSVTVTCTLYHIPTGQRVASGAGLCTTRESEYAYRTASRTCPACGAGAIIKGKREYGGGWVCFGKKGGCGAKFADGDQVIEGQPVGKVDNDQLADSYNTVLKMGCKRALTAAVLNGTAASDIFTQDLDDEAAESPAADAAAAPVDDPDAPGRAHAGQPPTEAQLKLLNTLYGKISGEDDAVKGRLKTLAGGAPGDEWTEITRGLARSAASQLIEQMKQMEAAGVVPPVDPHEQDEIQF